MTSHIRERSRCLEVLGLAQSASEDDIRKAYRNLALQYHPDKNKSEDATEKFQEIQGAYRYLTEGPSVHMHMHEDSDDDDDGIPFFILVRLFPWLFTGYPGPGPSRRHFDPFGYNTDSEDDDLGFIFGSPFGGYTFMRHAAGVHTSSSRGRGHASASGPGPSFHPQYGAAGAAESSNGRSKRKQKKKQAKQRKKAEKNATQATSNRSDSGAADNFPTSSTSNWGLSNNSSQQAAKTEKEKAEEEKAKLEAELAKREAQERKEEEREKIERRRAAEKAKKEEDKADKAEKEAEKAKIQAEKAQKAKEEAEKKRKEAEEAEKARREAEKIEKAKEAERVKQQKQEESRRRLEEKQRTARELEEMVRADKEKKERRLAAQREKERQEAEERARKEEEEIAEQARLLREEQQRKEEEIARCKKEEQDQKEMAQLLDDFDSDIFMDTKGDFVTWDTEGVGNIKKQPVIYDASGYSGYTAEEEDMSFGGGGDNDRFVYRGCYQGYRGRSPRRGRGRGRGHADFSSPPSSSSHSGYDTNSPPFEAWNSPPPPQGFPDFGYPPSSPGNQHGGFAQRADRGQGGQGFQGDRGRGGQGFQGDRGRGGQGFHYDRGDGFQNFRGRGRGQNDWENRGHGFPGQEDFNDNDVRGFEDPSYSKHPNQHDSAFSSGQGVDGKHQVPVHQPHPSQQQASNHQATFQGGQHLHHNSNIQRQFSGPYQPTSVPSNDKTNNSNPNFPGSNFPPNRMPSPSPLRPLQRPPELLSMGYNVGGIQGPPPPSSFSMVPPPGLQTTPSRVTAHPPFLQNQPHPLRLHSGFSVPPPSSVPAGSAQGVRSPPPGTPGFSNDRSGGGGGGGRGSAPGQMNRFSSGPQLGQQPQQPRFTTAAPHPFLMNPGLRQQRPYIPPFGSQPGTNVPQKPGLGGLLPRPGSQDMGLKFGVNSHINPVSSASRGGQRGPQTSSKLVDKNPSGGVDLHGLDDIDD